MVSPPVKINIRNNTHNYKTVDLKFEQNILEWQGKIIHSFISGMRYYECIVPDVDINLQSGRF